MKLCGQCGAPRDSTSIFCPGCGARVSTGSRFLSPPAAVAPIEDVDGHKRGPARLNGAALVWAFGFLSGGAVFTHGQFLPAAQAVLAHLVPLALTAAHVSL